MAAKVGLSYFALLNATDKHKHPNASRIDEMIPSPLFTIWLIVPAKKQQAAIAKIIDKILYLFI